MKTAITNGYSVVFDGNEHYVANDASVIIENDRVVDIEFNVKPQELGVERIIDASGGLIIPGLLNLHVHGSIQGTAIFSLDWGRRDVFSSNYLAYQPIMGERAKLTDEEIHTAILTSLINLLRNGSTTVMELGGIGGSAEMFAELAGKIGIRAYTAFGYRTAEYRYDENGVFEYVWDEEKGENDFKKAIEFVERYKDAFNGRVKAYLEPRNADTISPNLLRSSAEAAKDLGVLMQIHTAQSLLEFNSIVRRHNKTPVQFLHDLGMLGPQTILGHCVYTTGHSDVAWPGNRDQEILAETGTSVAHCPLVFTRNGRTFESFDRYRRLGVNLGIGTDTFPQDIINEMRLVSYMAKLVEKDFKAGQAWDVFNAATLGGAKALNREDLGKLTPGAKADLVIINLRDIRIGPFADPVKILVHVATGRDVDTVIVDGRVVVEKGKLLTMDIDEEKLIYDAQKVGEKIWGETIWPKKDQIHQGRA
jgi:cytosine/adenosine deaminase-related metal-dependent hydrolase